MPGDAVIGRVAVKVIPDTDRFRGEAQRALNKIERELRDLTVDIHVDVNSGSLYRAKSQLSILSRTRFADIVPKVNAAAAAKAKATLAALSGSRTLRNYADDFMDFIGNLDKSVPRIAGATLAITTLGSSLLTATSNSLAFGGSLASIAPAALALPGIFGGIAIGVTAFAVAMKDFNKYVPAFAVSGSRATTAGVAWKKLQDSMSANFWETAAKPMREFIGTLFPQFAAGMNKISTSLGRFTASLTTALTGKFDGALSGMFRDLDSSIVIMSGHTGSLAKIIRILGTSGAGYLPRLAHWFGDINDQFASFLGKAERNGDLQGWVDTGILALKDLGGVLKATGKTFYGLYSAAEQAGGSTLAIMRDTMEKVARVVNGNTFQAALSRVFAGAHEGFANITNGAGKQFESFLLRLSHVLSKVLPEAGDAVGTALGAIFDGLDQPQVAKAAVTLFENLNSAIHNLAPAMPSVGRGLAALAQVVGTLVVNLSRSLAPALETVATGVENLAPHVEPLSVALGNLLTSVIKGSSPILLDLVDVLGSLADALTTLLKPVQLVADLFGVLPDPIQAVLSKLVTVGLLVGGAMWLGAAARTKVFAFSETLLTAGASAGRAQGAFLNAAVAAETVGRRMSMARMGLIGAGLALGTVHTKSEAVNDGLSVLSTTATGAVIGSAFGPGWGTALGAAGGALYGLYKQANKAGDGMSNAATRTQNYIDTLDALHGTITQITTERAYEKLSQNNTLDIFRQLGVPDRDTVAAAMGNVAAYERVKERLVQAQKKGLIAPGKAELQYQLSYLDAEKKMLDRNTAAVRAKAAATADLKDLLDGFKPRLITEIDTKGIPQSVSEIAGLARRYNLMPKRVRTLVQALNIDLTDKQMRRLMDRVRGLDKATAHPKVEVETKVAEADTDKARRHVTDLNKVTGLAKVGIKDNATKPTQAVQAKLEHYGQMVVTAVLKVRDLATADINRVRGDLNSLDGKTATLTTYHHNVFTSSNEGGGGGKGPVGRVSAVFVAQRTADAITAAMVRAGRHAEKIARDLQKTYGSALGKIESTWKTIVSRSKDGATKAQKHAYAEVMADLRQQFATFNKAMAALDSAKAKLTALKNTAEQYRKSVFDMIAESGSAQNTGASTYDGIVQGLANSVDKAKQFKAVLRELVKAGLNKTTLKQILAAGPEQGLAYAQAIASGSVEQINALQKQLDALAGNIAKGAKNAIYGSQINQALQDVLDAQSKVGKLQDKLRQRINAMIDALVKQIRRKAPEVQAALQALLHVKGHGPDKGGSGGGGGGGTATRVVAPQTATLPSASAVTQTVVNNNQTLNYYAAPGRSISSEDDLFEAVGKAQGGWL